MERCENYMKTFLKMSHSLMLVDFVKFIMPINGFSNDHPMHIFIKSYFPTQ